PSRNGVAVVDRQPFADDVRTWLPAATLDVRGAPDSPFSSRAPCKWQVTGRLPPVVAVRRQPTHRHRDAIPTSSARGCRPTAEFPATAAFRRGCGLRASGTGYWP